tara:strand:- start:992 stop:1483 length:492 start_codon:yes stop_codon:yes gene_type:complete
MKRNKSSSISKFLLLSGFLLLLLFVIFQVYMYIKHSYNIKNDDETTIINFSGFSSTANWSIIFGLVGTALILGSNSITKDLFDAHQSVRVILAILLLIACVVMETLSYSSRASTICAPASGSSPQQVMCEANNEQQLKSDMYHNISIMCGILSISVLSIGLKC